MSLREIEVLGKDFKATVIVESEGREGVDAEVSNLVHWVDCNVRVR